MLIVNTGVLYICSTEEARLLIRKRGILISLTMKIKNLTEEGDQKTIEDLYCSSELTRQTPNHLITLLVLNAFVLITAFLENTIILAALRRESSLYPPSKLLYRNLAITDLCVGIIVEPFYVSFFFFLCLSGYWLPRPVA